MVVIPLLELTDADILADNKGVSAAANVSIVDLLNDVPTSAVDAPALGTVCPSCGAPLPVHANVCVSCGYHLQQGRRLTAVAAATKDPLETLPKHINVDENADRLQIAIRGAIEPGPVTALIFYDYHHLARDIVFVYWLRRSRFAGAGSLDGGSCRRHRVHVGSRHKESDHDPG